MFKTRQEYHAKNDSKNMNKHTSTNKDENESK